MLHWIQPEDSLSNLTCTGCLWPWAPTPVPTHQLSSGRYPYIAADYTQLHAKQEGPARSQTPTLGWAASKQNVIFCPDHHSVCSFLGWSWFPARQSRLASACICRHSTRLTILFYPSGVYTETLGSYLRSHSHTNQEQLTGRQPNHSSI